MTRFIPYKKPPIGQGLIYLTAFLFSMVVAIQSIQSEGGNVTLNLNHIILFSINYLLWALLVPLLYGTLVEFVDHSFTLLSILTFTLRLFSLILFHFVVSNLFYFGVLGLVSEYHWGKFISDVERVYLRAIASRSIDVIVILGLLKIIENYKALLSSKLQLSELEKQLSQSELNALKAQLNPHFLFNSLHALHALIGYDDDKAKAMTIKISHLLRKNLDQSNKHFVTLAEEIAYIQDYMDIELERFHDRLSIGIEMEQETKEWAVPNMILQPLIENAFKHGISQLEGNGNINVTASIKNGNLEIVITNSISPSCRQTSSSPSMGIGLNNVKARLKQAYSDNFEINLTSSSDQYIVYLTIPNNKRP